MLAKLSSVWNWRESLQTYIIQNTRKGVFKKVQQILTSWKLFNEFPDLRNGIQPEGVVSPHRTCVIWKEAIWERVARNILVQTFEDKKKRAKSMRGTILNWWKQAASPRLVWWVACRELLRYRSHIVGHIYNRVTVGCRFTGWLDCSMSRWFP